MNTAITSKKLLAVLLLVVSLDACSTEPVREHGKSLHRLITTAIQRSPLGIDAKHGCIASLEDQFQDQIGVPYKENGSQRFGAALFLGANYVSMSSMVIEEDGRQLVVAYRDIDGQHPIRNVAQSKIEEIYALIISASAMPATKSQAPQLHDSCIVFVGGRGGSESISVMAASATEDSSTPAGRASALLQELIKEQ